MVAAALFVLVLKYIAYLNKKTNSRYRVNNTATKKLILSKIRSGFTVEDFYTVIDIKCAEWLNNPNFSKCSTISSSNIVLPAIVPLAEVAFIPS